MIYHSVLVSVFTVRKITSFAYLREPKNYRFQFWVGLGEQFFKKMDLDFMNIIMNVHPYNSYCISDWTAAVERDVKIPWDLEATPLQIKTDSALGSGEKIFVRMFDKDNSWISDVALLLTSTIQYHIGQCSSWTLMQVPIPVEVDKIWTVTKTETAFIITCNNVEVLNYLFTDSSKATCVSKWAGDVVEEIMFHSDDTASDFYRAGKGLQNCCILYYTNTHYYSVYCIIQYTL